MADICLIYARPNRKLVKRLADILGERHSVWWDGRIHSGNYRVEIENELSQSKCVIPVWCRVSRTDGDVLDEAQFAQRRGISLLPIRIEDVDPPLGFGSLHTIDLIGWDGDSENFGVQQLLQNLDVALMSKPFRLRRVNSAAIDDRSLVLPAFFRSVSSHETQLRPEAAVDALKLLRTDAILVSAYDMIHETRSGKIARNLRRCMSEGSIIALDSGNYEAYRKRDNTWTQKKFHSALSRTPHDFAFCFDDLKPPTGVDPIVQKVVKACERDARHTTKPVVPIVHAVRRSNGGINASNLPEILMRVARELRPVMIAVPERELGDGLLMRARAIFQIRCKLDTLGFYQPLHILGTGNPISIAILSAAGADSFDGLEWCRTVVDHETALLYHFQQYEFFAWQSAEAVSPVVREAASSAKVQFAGKVAFHNLEFFQAWMEDVRTTIGNGRLDRLLTAKLPGGTKGLKQLESVVPELFA